MILGIGIDLVDIARMELAVKRTPSIVHKILTEIEVADLGIAIDQTQLHLNDQFVASLAARFAAKEATVKSLGLSLFEVGLHSIEVKSEKSGAPKINFSSCKHYLQSVDQRENVQIDFLCSLTHTDNSAGAVVVAQINA